MTKLILIGIVLFLVWIRIMLPFVRDSIISDQSLKNNPLDKRFRILLEELDRRVFGGNCTVNTFDENIQYLVLTGDNEMNVSYTFMYSTNNLTVQIVFNGRNKIIDKTYYNIETLSDADQIRFASIIEDETRSSFMKLQP